MGLEGSRRREIGVEGEGWVGMESVDMWEAEERRRERRLGGDVDEDACQSPLFFVRTSFSETERFGWALSSRRCRCCRFATWALMLCFADLLGCSEAGSTGMNVHGDDEVLAGPHCAITSSS